MFGGLGKLLGKSASGGGSPLSRLSSQYGDDMARKLSQQYGGDASASILSQLTNTPAAEAAQSVAKRSRIGDALTKASDTGLNAPLSLTRKGMREVGPDARQKIGKLYDRTGINDMGGLRKLGKELTGGENSFMDEVTNYMQTNGARGNNVDLSDIAPTIRDLNENLPKAIRNQVNAKDPVQLANYYRGAASDIRKSATPGTGGGELAKLFDNTAFEINSRIDAGIDPKYVQQAYTDTAEEFLNRSRKSLLSGDKKMADAYKRLSKEIGSTPPEERTVANFRSFKRDFVDIDKMGKLSDQADGGGSFSRTVNQVPVAGPMIDSLLSQPVEAGAQKAGAAMRDLGKKFQDGSAQQGLKQAALIGGGGIGALSALGASRENDQMGLPPVGGPGGGMPGDPSMMDPSMMGGGAAPGQPGGDQAMTQQAMMNSMQMQQPTVGGYNRNQLEEAYVAALMDNNVKAAQAIGTMISMIDDKEANAMKQQAAAAKSAGTKGQAGMGMLDTILQSFEAGGGAQGIVGGNVTNALNKVTGGGYNPNSQAYNQQSKAAATQIIKAMGESGQLTDKDIDRALAAIPQVTDTADVARIKVKQLREMLSQVQ